MGGGAAVGGHVALSDDGRLLATSSAGTVTVWDMGRRAPLFTPPEQGGIIGSLAWSRDGKHLAVGFSHGDPTLWDLSALRSELATIGLGW